jgi:hypothetical protein
MEGFGGFFEKARSGSAQGSPGSEPSSGSTAYNCGCPDSRSIPILKNIMEPLNSLEV